VIIGSTLAVQRFIAAPAKADCLFPAPIGANPFSIMQESPRPDQVGPFAPLQTLLWTGHFFLPAARFSFGTVFSPQPKW